MNKRKCDAFSFVLISQDCYSYLRSLVVPHEFFAFVFNFLKQGHAIWPRLAQTCNPPASYSCVPSRPAFNMKFKNISSIAIKSVSLSPQGSIAKYHQLDGLYATEMYFSLPSRPGSPTCRWYSQMWCLEKSPYSHCKVKCRRNFLVLRALMQSHNLIIFQSPFS